MKTRSPAIARKLKVGIKACLGLKGTKRVRIRFGPARGVTMRLDFSGHTPLYLGMYEWELHRFVREALAGARLVFDIGAYIGYDTLMFAANCDGRVLSVEPDPTRAQAIRANADSNPELGPRVMVAEVAVGSTDRTGVTTLDALSATTGQPDLVKIDIDGGEFDALVGASELLRTRRPHLLIETHSLDLEQKCGAFLIECGYKPIIKHNRRIWREHRGGVPHNRWLLARGKSVR